MHIKKWGCVGVGTVGRATCTCQTDKPGTKIMSLFITLK